MAATLHFHMRLRLAHNVIVFGVCPILWTLQEYGIHRWLMHGSLVPPILKSHMGHHKHPKDTSRLMIPWVLTTMGALANAFMYAIIIDRRAALSSLVGNVICYTLFEWAHMVCHHGHIMCTRSHLLQGVRRHHNEHHFLHECNFGFTSATWDVIFDTQFPRNKSLGGDHWAFRSFHACCPWPLIPFVITECISRTHSPKTK